MDITVLILLTSVIISVTASPISRSESDMILASNLEDLRRMSRSVQMAVNKSQYEIGYQKVVRKMNRFSNS